MGLALLQEDLAEALVRYGGSREEGPEMTGELVDSNSDVDVVVNGERGTTRSNDATSDEHSLRTQLKSWMTLIDEITASAKSSADVLDDLGASCEGLKLVVLPKLANSLIIAH